jgi:hypothetical protein
MMEYGEGLTPCGEATRWRRRFWASLALNVALSVALSYMLLANVRG